MDSIGDFKLNFIFLICSIFCGSVLSAVYTSTSHHVPCRIDHLGTCSFNETCEQSNATDLKGICMCKIGFRVIGGKCEKDPEWFEAHPVSAPESTTPLNPHALHKSERGGAGKFWGTIFGTFFTLVCVGFALVFFAHRYKWPERLLQLRFRRYNTVLVSSSNDDDAPIQ